MKLQCVFCFFQAHAERMEKENSEASEISKRERKMSESDTENQAKNGHSTQEVRFAL